jgi:hypothetical protein
MVSGQGPRLMQVGKMGDVFGVEVEFIAPVISMIW